MIATIRPYDGLCRGVGIPGFLFMYVCRHFNQEILDDSRQLQWVTI